MRTFSWIRRLFFLFLLGALLATAALMALLYHRFSLPATGVQVPIYWGSGVNGVAQALARQHLIPSPLCFRLLWVLEGRPVLHAGLYRFQGQISLREIFRVLEAGHSEPLYLTIVPGVTIAQIVQRVERAPYLDTRNFPAPGQLARALGQPAASYANAEGWLLPQSYAYVPGEPALLVLQRAMATMNIQLQELWRHRAAGLPLRTPYQALILASIVQKEGAPLQQQQKIAAVYVNRLRLGMPLQSDPTVIYALGKGYHPPLKPKDLQVRSPYNTYLHRGLPPTPIAMPSLQALQAVLHPAKSQDLFFIAKGDEYHYSRQYAQHQQQINQYLQ